MQVELLAAVTSLTEEQPEQAGNLQAPGEGDMDIGSPLPGRQHAGSATKPPGAYHTFCSQTYMSSSLLKDASVYNVYGEVGPRVQHFIGCSMCLRMFWEGQSSLQPAAYPTPGLCQCAHAQLPSQPRSLPGPCSASLASRAWHGAKEAQRGAAQQQSQRWVSRHTPCLHICRRVSATRGKPC